MAEPLKVVVAMSGGVDSSVAAALLKEKGYAVIGIMLRLWSEPGKEDTNRCCTPDAMAIARRVAARLEIPFYSLDAQKVFHDTVVNYFVRGYAQNTTPNPCLLCNRLIRWGFLLDYVRELGADFLATGHYAQLDHSLPEAIHLIRGRDAAKDQSYVLYSLTQEQLRQTLFPLGDLTKPQVRSLAQHYNLPSAARPDSQDLCFLGATDYREFLVRRVPGINQPGPIRNLQGTVLGTHQGLAFYTIGQRKGLGIPSPNPLYVLAKNNIDNTLVVGASQELGWYGLLINDVHWISGSEPVLPERYQVKIRYKAKEVWAQLSLDAEQTIRVQFDHPIRDITPGQAAVIYNDKICLGGGIISSAVDPLIRI